MPHQKGAGSATQQVCKTYFLCTSGGFTLSAPFSHGIDCPPLIQGQPFVDSLSCCCPGPKNIAPHSSDFVLAGLAHLLPDDVYFAPFSYRLTFLDRFIWSPVVCDPCPQCLIRNRTISQSNKLC